MKTLSTWSRQALDNTGRVLAIVWVVSTVVVFISPVLHQALPVSKNVYYVIALCLFLLPMVGMGIIGNEHKRRDKMHPWTAQKHH